MEHEFILIDNINCTTDYTYYFENDSKKFDFVIIHDVYLFDTVYMFSDVKTYTPDEKLEYAESSPLGYKLIPIALDEYMGLDYCSKTIIPTSSLIDFKNVFNEIKKSLSCEKFRKEHKLTIDPSLMDEDGMDFFTLNDMNKELGALDNLIDKAINENKCILHFGI